MVSLLQSRRELTPVRRLRVTPLTMTLAFEVLGSTWATVAPRVSVMVLMRVTLLLKRLLVTLKAKRRWKTASLG